MATASVTPEVLVWAREQAAMSPVEAARKVGVPIDRLSRWEDGQEQPTTSALTTMAQLYRRPLAVFFMKAPPAAEALPTDYRLRTVAGRPAELTRDLVVAIRQARAWQSIVARLADLQPGLVPQAMVPRVSTGEPPEAVAAQARAFLEVEEEEQMGWPSAEHAFGTWRERAESAGVLVFALRLDREICRAFSVWIDEGPPIIALATESDQARIFSLMHEFAHLMLGRSAICSEFEDESDAGRVETFCNRVAAGILMPASLVRNALDRFFPHIGEEWSHDDLQELARRLRVSVPATALRLEEIGAAPPGLYRQALSRPAPEIRRARGGGGASSWPAVRIAERGTNYSAALFRSWQSGIISTGDAARAMNVRPKYLSRIGDVVARRRERFA